MDLTRSYLQNNGTDVGLHPVYIMILLQATWKMEQRLAMKKQRS